MIDEAANLRELITDLENANFRMGEENAMAYDTKRSRKEADELRNKIDAIIARAESARTPAGDVDFPNGAIHNGRAFIERLETYAFENEATFLNMCTDWIELKRCFEYMAAYLAAMQPVPSGYVNAPPATGEWKAQPVQVDIEKAAKQIFLADYDTKPFDENKWQLEYGLYYIRARACAAAWNLTPMPDAIIGIEIDINPPGTTKEEYVSKMIGNGETLEDAETSWRLFYGDLESVPDSDISTTGES